MAKYRHSEESKIVLDDLENRLMQLIEVNNLHQDLHDSSTDKMIVDQNQGMGVALTLIRQIRNTGHVQRGTPVVPDDVEPLATTKWNHQPQLGLSELMLNANKDNNE